MADQSKLCTITNNSGQDAVVISTVAGGETTSQGAIVSFNQQLEILKTSSGNTVIKNGSSDTVTLDQAFPTDTGGTQYAFAYDLIISDSNWLCPLARLLVMQSIIGPPWFDPELLPRRRDGHMAGLQPGREQPYLGVSRAVRHAVSSIEPVISNAGSAPASTGPSAATRTLGRSPVWLPCVAPATRFQ